MAYQKPMIVFDLDDTLHMRSAPFADAVQELCHVDDPGQLEKMFADFRNIGVAYFHQWDTGEIDEQEMYILRTIDAFALYGYTFTREEAWHFHKTYEKYLQRIRPAEGIAEALQTAVELRLPMGILTNGSPVRQRNKIRALGLTKWIPEEYIAVSLELGVHKPDPRVFALYREKIRRLNAPGTEPADSLQAEELPEAAQTGRETESALLCRDVMPPDTWWYVGDLYENDIEPAAKDGWHTIWVQREEDRHVTRTVEPDFVVKDGYELEQVFRQIGMLREQASG